MIISISNQKGGVGKTTTATNIAGGLSQEGYKTLLVDLDPQANATIGLLGQPAEKNIYHVLTGKTTAKKVMIERSKNLYILPAGLELAGAVLEISNEAGREYLLKEALNTIKGMDYVIIDTPPDLSLLSQNAWTTSDRVIIPVQTEYYALHGLDQLISTIQKIKTRLNPSIEIMGVLPTMYDKRKKQHNEALKIIKDIGLNCFQSAIGTNSKLSEAPAESKTIQEYAPTSTGAKDYNNLVQEILKGV